MGRETRVRMDLYPGENLCGIAGRKCGLNHKGRDWMEILATKKSSKRRRIGEGEERKPGGLDTDDKRDDIAEEYYSSGYLQNIMESKGSKGRINQKCSLQKRMDRKN